MQSETFKNQNNTNSIFEPDTCILRERKNNKYRLLFNFNLDGQD